MKYMQSAQGGQFLYRNDHAISPEAKKPLLGYIELRWYHSTYLKRFFTGKAPYYEKAGTVLREIIELLLPCSMNYPAASYGVSKKDGRTKLPGIKP